MNDRDRLYTTKQAADASGISDGRLRQIAPGLGVGKKFGRSWMFTAQDIEVIRARPDLRRKDNAPDSKAEGV